MVRSFEVRTDKQGLVCNLARNLDKELVELQQDGWEIISVVGSPCKEWEACEGYFDSVLFTIIAERSETCNGNGLYNKKKNITNCLNTNICMKSYANRTLILWRML